MTDFGRSRIQTARKEHVCLSCGTPILVGEKYEYYAGIDADSGTFGTAHTCAKCSWVMDDPPRRFTPLVIDA